MGTTGGFGLGLDVWFVTAIRFHSFIHSLPKESLGVDSLWLLFFCVCLYSLVLSWTVFLVFFHGESGTSTYL